MEIQLGNVAPIQGKKNDDDSVSFSDLDGKRVTYIHIPDEYSLGEALTCITSPQGVWANHSKEPAAWVTCSNPAFEALLADHFKCDVGAPEDVEDTHHTNSGPPLPSAAEVEALPKLDEPEVAPVSAEAPVTEVQS